MNSMFLKHSANIHGFRWFTSLALFVAVCCCGCSGCSGTQSSDEGIKAALTNANQEKHSVAPLAGKVTIDGQPPHFDKPNQRIFVMLNDPQKPDVPLTDRPTATANSEGEFAFSTYNKGDGWAPGHYVLTFAVLTKKGKKGDVGPDALNNLYNDPDVNAKTPEFVIDHQSPGKSDYAFDLKIEGKEPVKTPGPHALTTLETPTK